MARQINLFRFLNEFIVMLLGALLILLSMTGRIGLPSHPGGLVALGVLFLYWGLRAGMRREAQMNRWESLIRAGSLILVGLIVVVIQFVPFRYTSLLFALAGSFLILRGILGAVFSFLRT
jgi:hypothetical protein